MRSVRGHRVWGAVACEWCWLRITGQQPVKRHDVSLRRHAWLLRVASVAPGARVSRPRVGTTPADWAHVFPLDPARGTRYR